MNSMVLFLFFCKPNVIFSVVIIVNSCFAVSDGQGGAAEGARLLDGAAAIGGTFFCLLLSDVLLLPLLHSTAHAALKAPNG